MWGADADSGPAGLQAMEAVLCPIPCRQNSGPTTFSEFQRAGQQLRKGEVATKSPEAEVQPH